MICKPVEREAFNPATQSTMGAPQTPNFMRGKSLVGNGYGQVLNCVRIELKALVTAIAEFAKYAVPVPPAIAT